MKKTLLYTLTLALSSIALVSLGQSDTSEVNEEIIINTKGLKVVVKEKAETKSVNQNGDSIVTKTMSIETTTEENVNEEKSKSDIAELRDRIKKHKEDKEAKEPEFVETSWNNFGLGLNNLINSKGALEPEAGYADMSISAGNSVNFDWKIVTQAMNLYKGNVRLVYGIGIDFNNYRFEKNINLSPDSVPLSLAMSGTDYKKNKLVTQYLTVPVLLNFKFSPKHDNEDYVYISGGANFGYLIGSHQKQVWNDNGKKKIKTKDDFNLEQFRMGYEVQFGYKNIVLFGKYFPNSMFKTNQGPDLRTVTAGILIGKV
jgi:hypothetical protein